MVKLKLLNKEEVEEASRREIIALGKQVVKEKYGNLFDMYEKITGENPYEVTNENLSCCSLHHGWLMG
jgi:hypothetical protein